MVAPIACRIGKYQGQFGIQAASSTAVHKVCTKRVALLLEKVPRGPIFLLRRAAQAFDNTRSLIQTVYRYSREDLARILQVSPRQLLAWEKAGLLTRAESYNFFDLLQVKKLRDFCARHVRPIEIRQSLLAMQEQVAGMENPLLEANASTSGRHRVAFRHEGRLLEPIAG